MSPIRVATFNCENLFSRPKLFNLSTAKSNEMLGYVADLQAELKKAAFDHPAIKDLEKKLSGYATVNDLRGKHDSVAGAAEWVGTVELTRDDVQDAAVRNTAHVIADVNADVICLMEIEGRTELQKFHDDVIYPQFLKPAGLPPYERILLIDGNDERGIDVALMSRHPVNWLKTHIHERTTYLGKDVALYSRDCLEVEVDVGSTQPLHLLVNHLKSMGYSSHADPQSNIRRLDQAQHVMDLAKTAYTLQTDYVIVAGDLNSPPSSPSLAPLVQANNGLYNSLLQLPAAADRITYKTGNQQIDYIFLSDALKPKLANVHVERHGMFSTKWPHYPEVTGVWSEASDHGAVVVDLNT